MATIIVTKQCFLVCDRVISIVLDEAQKEDNGDDDSGYKRQSWSFRKTAAKGKPSEWFIELKYIPETNNGSGQRGPIGARDMVSLEIRLFDKEEAFKLFREIVQEIREQTPDELYLDQIVNKLLEGDVNAD